MCEHCETMSDKIHELDKKIDSFIAVATPTLKDIKTQVLKTNGRVTKQENWRSYTAGAVGILSFISCWFWVDYIKNRDTDIHQTEVLLQMQEDVQMCNTHLIQTSNK